MMGFSLGFSRASYRQDGIVLPFGYRGDRGMMLENALAGFVVVPAVLLRIVELDVPTIGDKIPEISHGPMLEAYRTRDSTDKWPTGEESMICHLTYAK